MTPAASAPRRRPRLDRLAGRLALAGAALGVVAGLIDVAAGASMRDWVGGKQDTTRLGLATVVLALVPLGAAIGWLSPRRRNGGARLAMALACLVPAVICFTTIGRLWYLPGSLLVGAGALVLITSGREELVRAVDRDRWRLALLVLLGAFEVFLGADALPAPVGELGVFGGALVIGSVVAVRHSPGVAAVLLALGAVPFAVLTWWSVVTPLIAISALIIGAGAFRASPRSISVRRHQASRPEGAP